MTYELKIDQKPGYLHAIVTGPNTLENVKGYVGELLGACASRGCFRVLIEERLEGPRLGFQDVFHVAQEGSRKARAMKAIAYVDVNAAGNLMEFAEDVAVNRGVPLAVFSTVPDAEKWLRETGG